LSTLLERMQKNSTIAETALLEHSILWEKKDIISTRIPALNIALSGNMFGGMGPGLLQIAGASKRFKSKFALEIADSFLKQFPDGVVLFYDTEFGTPQAYFGEMNIGNIIHSPVVNLEVLTHDIVTQFDGIVKNDKILVILDSLGNAPSIKEAADALAGKGTQDMTRARAIKSMFRIIGPYLGIKNIYMVVINHTYKTLEMYAKEVVSGGSGTEYNSNGIWVIGAEKNRDGDKELVGFNFNIRVEKSRFVKQDKKIPITVSFESGIDKWSGTFDLGIDLGYIKRPNNVKYAFSHTPEITFGKKDINEETYRVLMEDTDFPLAVEKEFTL
jgi:hypothetical protein